MSRFTEWVTNNSRFDFGVSITSHDYDFKKGAVTFKDDGVEQAEDHDSLGRPEDGVYSYEDAMQREEVYRYTTATDMTDDVGFYGLGLHYNIGLDVPVINFPQFIKLSVVPSVGSEVRIEGTHFDTEHIISSHNFADPVRPGITIGYGAAAALQTGLDVVLEPIGCDQEGDFCVDLGAGVFGKAEVHAAALSTKFFDDSDEVIAKYKKTSAGVNLDKGLRFQMGAGDYWQRYSVTWQLGFDGAFKGAGMMYSERF